MPGVLSENQILFRNLFQDQFKQELQFIDDVANGRATERVGFSDKALALLSSAVGATTTVGGAAKLFDALGLTDLVTGSVSSILSAMQDHTQDSDTKILKALMLTYQKRRTGLENVIDEAAHQLSIQLANIINRVEKDSIPILVHGLVLRIIEYCSSKNLKDADLNINELFLEGIILGSSGAFNEGFRNIPLELQEKYRSNEPSSTLGKKLKEMTHLHAFTVEGVGRTGFVYSKSDDADKSIFLVHNLVERGSVQERASHVKQKMAERTEQHSTGRALRGVFKAIHQAKSSYTKLDEDGNVKYGFIQILDKQEAPHATLNTYAGITARDAATHKELVGDARLIHVNELRLRKYLQENKTNPQSLNQYFKGIAVLDESVDIKKFDLTNADFSDSILSRVKFTDAKLENVNFSNALMVEANLNGATLNNCNMSNCNLGSAQLVGAQFNKVDLTMANCSATNCTNAEFVDIKYLGSRWDDAKLVDVKMNDSLKSEFSDHRSKMQKWRVAQHKKMQQIGTDIDKLEAKLIELTDKQTQANEQSLAQLDALRKKMSSAVDNYQNGIGALASITQNHNMSYQTFRDMMENKLSALQSEIATINEELRQVQRNQLMQKDLFQVLLKNAQMVDNFTQGRNSPPAQSTATESKVKLPDWQMPLKDSVFIPMPTVMNKLQEISNQPDAATKVLQISGKPKSGKSACVKQFCHQLKEQKPETLILWLNVNANESLEEAYFKMAASYNKGSGRSRQAIINDFKAMLEERGNWLLVIDDATDLKKAETLFPARGGTVIATTEKPNPNFASVLVTDFSEDQAKKLISHLIKFKDPTAQELNALYQYCGGWPGAIKDICHFMNESPTLASGLKKLDEQLQKSSKKDGKATGLSLSVTEQLDEKLAQLDDASKEVLKRMKYYNALKIPMSLLADNYNLHFDTIRDICSHLEKMHLVEIKKDKGHDIVSISPLYQSVLRTNESLTLDENVRDFLSAIERTFAFYHAELNPNSPAFRSHDTLWEHMQGLVEHYTHLADEIDHFYLNNPQIKAQRYQLLLLFGYQARHHYENGNLDAAFKNTRQALEILMKFDNTEITDLMLNPNHTWAKDRFSFMQKVLRDVVNSDDPTKVNTMQKMQATNLLRAVDDINSRLMALADARTRQQTQELAKQQRTNQLDQKIEQVNERFTTSATSSRGKSVTITDKQNAVDKYIEILSKAESVDELNKLYDKIKTEDRILQKNAKVLGVPLPGVIKNSALGSKHKLEKFVIEKRAELEAKEAVKSGPDKSAI